MMRWAVPRVQVFIISPGIKMDKTPHRDGKFFWTIKKRVFQQNRPIPVLPVVFLNVSYREIA